MIRSAMSGAIDLIYPRFCAVCDGSVEYGLRYLCWDCLANVDKVQPPFCSVCGDPVDGMIGHEYICSWCSERRPYFDVARSAVRYCGGMKKIMHAFKYENASYLSKDLASLLVACVDTHYSNACFDAVVFVPLHASKERNRTYNQSYLLAKDLASKMGLPVVSTCLKRVRETKTQTGMSARQRMWNVRDAFDVKWSEWVEGRRFLMVDDVMTTGATVDECAKVLKQAGAAGVSVITVARG